MFIRGSIANRIPHSIQGHELKIENAFTFIELMIVMVIVAIVAAIVIPQFDGLYSRVAVDNGARSIADLALLAKSRADTQRLIYQLNFNIAEGAYWLTVESDPLNEPGEFYELEDSYGKEERLPQSVYIERIDVLSDEDQEDDYKRGEIALSFYPDGSSDDFKVTLVHHKGDVKVVYVSGVDGNAFVLSEKEAKDISTEPEFSDMSSDLPHSPQSLRGQALSAARRRADRGEDISQTGEGGGNEK